MGNTSTLLCYKELFSKELNITRIRWYIYPKLTAEKWKMDEILVSHIYWIKRKADCKFLETSSTTSAKQVE
jgi:hypothetical protein